MKNKPKNIGKWLAESSTHRDNDWLEEMQQELDKREFIEMSAYVAAQVHETLGRLKLTQKDLAERLKITQQAVSKMLSGSQNFTLETICDLNNALNIKISINVDDLDLDSIFEPVVVKKIIHKPFSTSYELTTFVELSARQKKKQLCDLVDTEEIIQKQVQYDAPGENTGRIEQPWS